MKNEFKKGIHELRGIKLSQNEKDTIFSAILEHTAITTAAAVRPTASPFFSLFSFKNAMMFASIILLLGVGTASYAAEGALPGEGSMR
jgi:hypothetical protein